MSTRSNIAILNSDGTVTAICCRWDGYLDRNGLILSKYYSEPQQARALINGGDLSVLTPNINPPDFTQFESESPEDTQLRKYSSILELCQTTENSNIEYLYLYIGGDWWYWNIYRAERFTLKHLKTDIKDLEK